MNGETPQTWNEEFGRLVSVVFQPLADEMHLRLATLKEQAPFLFADYYPQRSLRRAGNWRVTLGPPRDHILTTRAHPLTDTSGHALDKTPHS